MDIVDIRGFPIYGWLMAGYFWAIIGTGIALAFVGWHRRSGTAEEEGRYVVLRERQPQPWPGRAMEPPPEAGGGTLREQPPQPWPGREAGTGRGAEPLERR